MYVSCSILIYSLKIYERKGVCSVLGLLWQSTTLEVNKTTETKPSQIVPKTRSQVKVLTRDCLGDAVDKNPPAKVGDMGSIPSLGRFPGLQSNWAHMLQLLKPVQLEPMLSSKRRHCKEKPANRLEE